MKLPKIQYVFPSEIKMFAKKEKILLKDVKSFVEPNLCEDLEDYVANSKESFEVVITGIHLKDKKEVKIGTKLAKKKPILEASAWFPKFRVYYAIFQK